AISFKDLQSGEQVAINDRVRLHAASTMKLPVLMEAHRLAALGKLRFDEPVLVENSFHSIVDQSPFTLDPKDDTDDWMYAQLGKRVAFGKLLERMIVRSSNLATNLVMDRVPAMQVTALCRSLGAPDIEVLRGVEDGKAHDKGLDNTATARDLRVLLEELAKSPAMVDLLSRQELNEGIPSALPKGTRVAHKTGSITRHYHDAAIVFPKGRKPYLLVVLTKGFETEADAVQV